MSRSNNTEIISPAKRSYEWVGSTGCLRYFDKNKGDNGERIDVKLPFTFLVLDRLSSIKGYSDADKSGFWSNEIRDIKKDILTVRTKKGTVATGVYSSLAPILNQGACYSQSVYIAIKENNEMVIANIAIHGSAIGEWIDLCKGKNIYKYAITIASAKPMKKGTNHYFAPLYKLNPKITEETEQKCIELDKQLQEYLTISLNRNKTEQQENLSSADIVTEQQRTEINNFKQEPFDDVNALLAGDSFTDDAENDLPF